MISLLVSLLLFLNLKLIYLDILYSKSGLNEAEFSKLHANAKRGDIVGVTGFPGLCSLYIYILFIFSFLKSIPTSYFTVRFTLISGKTKRGELSIFPRSFILLSHCLHMMPRKADNVNAKVQ